MVRGHIDPCRGHTWLRYPWPHSWKLMPPPVSPPGGTGCVYCPYSGERGECHGRRESLRDPHSSQHPQQGPGFPALFHPLPCPGDTAGVRWLGVLQGCARHLWRRKRKGSKKEDESEQQTGREGTESTTEGVSKHLQNTQPHQSSNFKCIDSFRFPFTQSNFILFLFFMDSTHVVPPWE